MKNITKENKGITLVALIITVIITLILTTVITYTGIDTYKFSKVNAFVTEMQLIQSKVDEIKNEKTMNELMQLGTTVNSNVLINSAFANNEISSNDASKCRYFTKEALQNEFDLEGISSDVIINFTTREVISVAGVEYNEKKYYTQYKLPGGQEVINNNDSSSRELEFSVYTSIDGLNCNLVIDNVNITNGSLKFAEIDSEGNVISNWQTITNDTNKGKIYSTNISKTGSYIIKLQDNTNKENYVETIIEIILTNKPKTNLGLEYNYGAVDSDLWAYAQKDTKNYVWIPRFAYLESNSDNIKFIKGNSNIATDNTYIDDWKIHEKFTISDGTELTGIWIKVETPNQKGLNMLELLNSSAETLIEILN